VQFAVAIVRRRSFQRTALFEEKQYMAVARLQGAAAASEIADHTEPKDLLVESDRGGNIIHIERRFQDAVSFRGHDA
jgi:hypothetical protein